jgi:hypothetical protein
MDVISALNRVNGISFSTAGKVRMPPPHHRIPSASRGIGTSRMTTSLAGKIVLVTGASRGIGYQAALEARRGAHVIAVARTVGGLEELDDEIQKAGSSATLVPMDLRGRSTPSTGWALPIFERWGHLDGLIANAGQCWAC